MSDPRNVELAAALSAVQRRLAMVEALAMGRVTPELSDLQLLGLYTAASRALLAGQVGESLVAGWAHAAMVLDEVLLLRMGRLVNDPFPWVPLLRLVTRLRKATKLSELRAAEAHLRSVARGLLDAQGLRDVHLDDLAARELPVVEALRVLTGASEEAELPSAVTRAPHQVPRQRA